MGDVVEKARFLLKLRVPDEFRQALREEKANEVRRQISLQKNSSSQGGSFIGLNRQKSSSGEPGLHKSQSIREWTERVQNWQQMQLNQNTVTDFSTPGMNSSMSCSLMVL